MTFGDVVTHCFSGATPRRNRPDFFKGDIRWITSGELNYKVITDTHEKITSEAVARTNLSIVPAGTFLMAITGLEAEKTRGSCGIVGAPSTTNQSCMAVFPNDKLVTDFLFFYYVLRGKSLAFRYCQGTKQQSYTAKLVKRLPVVIPSTIDEQRTIAAVLSDVDALLDGLDRLIAKKRYLKQASMQQLLTGQTRLPGFAGEWKLKRLGDTGRCLRGVSYRGDRDLAADDTEHTKRLLRANNVKNAAIVTQPVQFVNSERVANHQILVRDDILVCMANGSKSLVGKAGLFAVEDGHEYTFGAFMGCFRTDASVAHPKYSFALFQTGRYGDYINNLLVGSSINNLTPSSIESIQFQFPDLREQTAIAAVLSDMDAELAAIEARRDKTHALKQAMMQELLTGRTRLI